MNQILDFEDDKLKKSSIKNNIFFIEENNKNFFYVESYGGSRYSFIACAEKAKQSSIWNWTKSN